MKKALEEDNRQFISDYLKELSEKDSQARVANRIGVSTATLSHIIRRKWDNIRPGLFRKVQAELHLDPNWRIAETKNMMDMLKLLTQVQENSLSVGIAAKAGIGKSAAYREYTRRSDNVVYLECKNSWHKKTYLLALLKAAGLHHNATTGELIEMLIDHLRSLHKPIVIIDQADKLKDNQLDLFMDFYNDLSPFCGFVISGVKALEKRVLKGVQQDKVGYAEIYSRLGSRFIKLAEPDKKSVAMICEVNGFSDPIEIDEIMKYYNGDLRRIEREIKKRRIQQKKHKVA